MFKLDNKHFEVKVKKDQEPTDQPMIVHRVFTKEEVESAVDSVVYSLVGAAIVYKASTTFFRIVEHLVVTKVN